MAIHPGLNSRYTVDQKKGEKTMAYLKGYVDHIRFRNEDNGYTVLSCLLYTSPSPRDCS